MTKKLLTAIVVTSLGIATLWTNTAAQTLTMQELHKVEKTRNKVARFVADPKPHVIVELEGGETVKGTVTSMASDSFVIETKANDSREIAYLQVKDIRKKPGAGYWVAVVGATGAASVGALYLTGYLLSKCARCID
jgi:hypothetical protein